MDDQAPDTLSNATQPSNSPSLMGWKIFGAALLSLLIMAGLFVFTFMVGFGFFGTSEFIDTASMVIPTIGFMIIFKIIKIATIGSPNAYQGLIGLVIIPTLFWPLMAISALIGFVLSRINLRAHSEP